MFESRIESSILSVRWIRCRLLTRCQPLRCRCGEHVHSAALLLIRHEHSQFLRCLSECNSPRCIRLGWSAFGQFEYFDVLSFGTFVPSIDIACNDARAE